ncbi:MAG: RHS repeat-associated core domain-containing protein, partial [Planctomycetota bacterium]
YSPAALAAGNGTVLERYEYDAYGNPYVLEPNFADDPDGKTDWANPYYFTGRRADFLDGNNLTLQINRHRYYDYYTGRWLTHDPLGLGLSRLNPTYSTHVSMRPSSQYLDGANLYQYGKGNPVGAGDPMGLWGSNVHKAATCRWAYDVEMCFHWAISTWANAPDRDPARTPVGTWRNLITGGAGSLGAFRDILADLVSGRNPLAPAGGLDNLFTIAYWHFPGADTGARAVTPGDMYATREVKKGVRRCNLHIFSEGLHQLQDSYSHQSGGRQPPVGMVGHSRDRSGFYDEGWNDQAANPYAPWIEMFRGLSEGERTWMKKLARRIVTVTSTDTDNTIRFADDLEDTKTDTQEWMKKFMRECPQMKEGPFTGECTCCPRRKY